MAYLILSLLLSLIGGGHHLATDECTIDVAMAQNQSPILCFTADLAKSGEEFTGYKITKKDDKVYIYSLDEYNELYGEKNQIISPVTLKVYKTLTLASTIFTVVIAFAIAMLIIVYTRPEEDELLKKVTSRPKKSIDTKETINNIESTKTIEVQKNTTQRKSASNTSKTTTKKSSTTKKQSNKNEK